MKSGGTGNGPKVSRSDGCAEGGVCGVLVSDSAGCSSSELSEPVDLAVVSVGVSSDEGSVPGCCSVPMLLCATGSVA